MQDDEESQRLLNECRQLREEVDRLRLRLIENDINPDPHELRNFVVVKPQRPFN